MIRVLLAFLIAISAYSQNPKTADFPTSVAVDQTLLAAKDLSQSTLSAGITNSTLTVPVADGTMFIGYELIRIDDEQMLICSIATNTLTICGSTRGYGGTTAASHLSGAAVRGIITSSHHNQLAAELKTMQARLRDATGYCADAGSNDTYACSPAPCIASYSTGNRFWFKANTANTGAATVNFCSVGAKTIKKAVGGVTTDLADNDIRAGQIVEVIYDGTNMQMLSVLGNAAASAAWGSITGTLSSQSDLQSALNAKLTTATGQAGTPTYCRSTTGNDTYTCTLTPTLTAYTRGGCLTLDADAANTLAASVNVDALGAKSILNRAGSSLATGDITANKPITICYDGTQYIIQGDGGGSGAGDALQSAVQSGSYLKCSVGSGGSPYTCTMTPTLAAYTDGMRVNLVRTGGTTESGSVTLNIDSLGATAIKKHGGTTNPGSLCNIPAGPSVTTLVYNAANSVFWLPPCVGADNRGDAVGGTDAQSGAYLYCPTGGTSTAYTCSLANSINGGNAPALLGYTSGESFIVKFNANSGANPTLNIDSLGAKKIYHKYSTGTATQIAAGELVANRVYTFQYNSSLDSGSGGFETNTGAVDPAATLAINAVDVGGTGAGVIKYWDPTHTYYSAEQGPDSPAASVTYKHCDAAPSGGQVRQWSTPSGGVSTCSWVSAGSMDYASAATWTAAGAASTPAAKWTGAPYAAGTGTTAKALLLIEPAGTTAGTSWLATGTALGINVPNGGGISPLDIKLDGASVVSVSQYGAVAVSGNLTAGSSVVTQKFSVEYSGSASVSGCSAGTISAGATAGTFVSNSSAACTFVITMGNSQSSAVGWSCWMSNQTTAYSAIANVPRQTASSTTTATINATTTSGDVMVWGCVGR